MRNTFSLWLAAFLGMTLAMQLSACTLKDCTAHGCIAMLDAQYAGVSITGSYSLSVSVGTIVLDAQCPQAADMAAVINEGKPKISCHAGGFGILGPIGSDSSPLNIMISITQPSLNLTGQGRTRTTGNNGDESCGQYCFVRTVDIPLQ